MDVVCAFILWMRVRLPLLKLFTFAFNKNLFCAIPVYCFPFFFSAYFCNVFFVSFIC